jgi:hypothetical protein
MMYSVATEDGALTPEEERHILLLLNTKIGLEDDVARSCLIGGRRIARYLRGDLNSRLHQLLGPIERKCGPTEKQDVLDMLNAVAGRSAEHLGAVREGLGRVSSPVCVVKMRPNKDGAPFPIQSKRKMLWRTVPRQIGAKLERRREDNDDRIV